MLKLYELLRLPFFEHDFDNVNYEGGGEFDHWLWKDLEGPAAQAEGMSSHSRRVAYPTLRSP